MCGICGLVSGGALASDSVVKMRAQLRHRGPDDEGMFHGGTSVLGHTRLSIIDLTASGHQPMSDADGRLHVSYNGEIFNYEEIRAQLISRGHRFRSTSDTEVILHSYAEWGPECLQRFVGMFAFVILDAARHEVFMARDRLGIKPLYFAEFEGSILFASEVKSILAAPGFPRNPNYNAIRQYWEGTFSFDCDTWFEGVKQLEAGHYAVWSAGKLTVKQYWDVEFEKQSRSEADTVDKLRSLLGDAVRSSLRSDVPVGAHLSGGLDSSTVTALAAQNGAVPHAFSGSYPEAAFDESPYADLVARRYDIKMHTVCITPEFLERNFERLIWHMDYPIAGPGAISHLALYELIHSTGIKVVLSGHGGDELFAGYFDRHQEHLKALLSTGQVTKFAGASIATLRQFGLRRILGVLQRRRQANRASDLLSSEFVGASAQMPELQLKGDNPADQRMYWDLKYRLPALLHVEDRTSMAFSIESRVPLLDHRLVEFAASVPFAEMISEGRTKSLMRKAVADLLPAEITARRDKVGFAVPLQVWFPGPLRSFCQSVLASDSLRSRGIFSKEVNGSLLNQVTPGGTRHDNIWKILNIELWFRKFIDAPLYLP